jgi:hypothetical protein
MIGEPIMSGGFDPNSVRKVISVEPALTSRGRSSPNKMARAIGHIEIGKANAVDGAAAGVVMRFGGS